MSSSSFCLSSCFWSLIGLHQWGPSVSYQSYLPSDSTSWWKKDQKKVWVKMWITHTLIVKIQIIQSLWKTVWKLLKKLDMQYTIQPSTCTLGHLPQKMRTYVHTKICTQMFIAILFVIVDNCSQSRSHLTVVWLNK